ncbi:hypothetical protein CDAR_321661 [Caerostris darwini]|uniref:Uncharacterized protein n=1 Tax=Caerostris darwini TaxID=1538125 RepID=A0AAV4VVN8_9ARAC|nr:hypothetical protein CDAR_321661 [Caerostris darwini]
MMPYSSWSSSPCVEVGIDWKWGGLGPFLVPPTREKFKVTCPAWKKKESSPWSSSSPDLYFGLLLPGSKVETGSSIAVVVSAGILPHESQTDGELPFLDSKQTSSSHSSLDM